MPIVLAYICPRTKSLFLDKESYVLHLRSAAIESRRKKMVEREIAPLRATFDALRLCASGASDILTWLEINRREIIRIACLIDSRFVADRAVALKQKIKPDVRRSLFVNLPPADDEVESQDNSGSIAMEIILEPAGSKRIFFEMVCVVLRELPELYSHALRQQLVLNFSAEDWPCVARVAMYQFSSDIDKPEDPDVEPILMKILARRYPLIPFEQYKALCKSCMLAGAEALWDESAFTHWLEHGHEDAQDLPDLVASGGLSCR